MIDRLDDFFSRGKMGKYTSILAVVVGLVVSISTYFAKDEPVVVTQTRYEEPELEPLPEAVAPAASAALGYTEGPAAGGLADAPPLAFKQEPEPPPAAAPRAPAARAAADDAAKMTDADKAALEAATGGWSGAKAAALGATRGALFKLGETVLRYPRVVRFVLDNDAVVAGFMSQERVKANCHSPQTLFSYLTNTRDGTGIKKGIESFERALTTPGSAEAIFGSKLVSTVLDRCGSIPAVTQDGQAVIAIHDANPGLARLMADVRLAKAVSTNSEAAEVYNDVRKGLMGVSSVSQESVNNLMESFKTTVPKR